MCVVSFDEMTVRANLTFLREADMLEGYRGITEKWKQSVGYFLPNGPVKAVNLKSLIFECMTEQKKLA